jgi:uncharacterized protein
MAPPDNCLNACNVPEHTPLIYIVSPGTDMKLELENHSGQLYLIKSYQPGCVVINEQHYTTSLILSPERVISDWPPRILSELTAQHLEALVELQPELVILGTGLKLEFPTAEVLDPLLARSIGFEVMDTGAACRGYNILMAEGRRVVAGLLMIDAD